MTDKKKVLGLSLGTILLCSLARIFPHPPNFTPVIAASILGGYFLKDLRMAILFPLSIMFLSDIFLGLHSLIPITYSALALCSWLSFKFHKGSLLRLSGIGITAPILFFVISNFGVWAKSGLYATSFHGLVQCYVAAIPFFERSLSSTIGYLALAILFHQAAMTFFGLNKATLAKQQKGLLQ